MLGIDEHFFSRKDGYATTFCDLRSHTIFDVVLGRSEAALEEYLAKLRGKEKVRVVCMDLASVYRALVRKYLPNARIVADRFHVMVQLGETLNNGITEGFPKISELSVTGEGDVPLRMAAQSMGGMES